MNNNRLTPWNCLQPSLVARLTSFTRYYTITLYAHIGCTPYFRVISCKQIFVKQPAVHDITNIRIMLHI